MPKQRIMLEHESYATVGDTLIRHLDAMQENSSLVGPLQSGQDSQQGSLSATGGAEERNEFSRLCMQAHVIEDGEGAKSFGDMIDLDTHDGLPGCVLHAGSCADRDEAVFRSIIVFAMSVTMANKVRSEATANAPTALYSLYRISTCSGIVLVSPRIWPETTETAPNSPIARALQRIAPYSSPPLMFGSVTRKKVCQPLAPSTTAASSSSVPCACISGISSLATKGTVMNMVASTIPGAAN